MKVKRKVTLVFNQEEIGTIVSALEDVELRGLNSPAVTVNELETMTARQKDRQRKFERRCANLRHLILSEGKSISEDDDD